MGILDDAIREHLDLKRRQGAGEEELQRLEDEAFGPPSRPGDPDFAERASDGDEAAGSAGNGDAEGAAAQATALHDQDMDMELEHEPASPAASETGELTPAPGTEEAEVGSDAPDLAREPTVEHDTLGEEEAVDLDLDLEIDDEIEDVGELELEDEDEDIEASAAPDTAPAAPPAEEPIESLDTVEHHFENAIDEAEVVDDESEGSPEESEDEDVLEETPEFLRDAPEDDELWFEQGEPKDFDF